MLPISVGRIDKSTFYDTKEAAKISIMHDIRTYVMQKFISRLWQRLGCVYTGPTPVLASGPAANAWAVESGAPGRRECVQLLHQRLQTLVQCRRTRVEVPRVGTDPSGQFGPLSDRHTRIPPSDYGTFTCRNTICDTAKGRIEKWNFKWLKSSSFVTVHAGSSAKIPIFRLSKIMLPCILTTTDRGAYALTFVMLTFTTVEGHIRLCGGLRMHGRASSVTLGLSSGSAAARKWRELLLSQVKTASGLLPLSPSISRVRA